ncbi:MAG: 4Fe-4S binding protein [Methanobrevibacter sp.]|nr:4Fe-4S binding protein [Methanobrevibacter sp.]
MTSIVRKGKEDRELSHINHKCVGCGICIDICPTESLKLGPVLPICRGLLEMDFVSVQKDTCVLCGICSFACPVEAFDFKINNETLEKDPKYPKWECGSEIEEEKCIYCGNCKTACPREAIFINRKLPDRKNLVMGETEIYKDKCIYCGICEEICPADAVTIYKNDISSIKQYTAENIEIDEDKCIYCGICKRACPEEAMKIVCTTCMDNENIPKVEITGDIALEQDMCINCGWCEEICPMDAAKVIKPFEGEVIVNTEIECKGDSCHACQDVCQCNAVSIVDNTSKINPAMCMLCGACVKACPQDILDVKRTEMRLTNIRSSSWQKILGSLLE